MKGKKIKDENTCEDVLLRAWSEPRCLRVCKTPRKEYQFNRRKYRCFKLDPEDIRKRPKVCAVNKVWSTITHACEEKIEIMMKGAGFSVEVEDKNKWCEEGKMYQKITRKSSKRKRRNLKRCKSSNVNFENKSCKECVRIKKSVCRKLGREYDFNDEYC